MASNDEKPMTYPKQKTYLIFEIPTIENPRIVISNCLQWFQPPPRPPKGALDGVWRYSESKRDIIFEIITIESPKFDIL